MCRLSLCGLAGLGGLCGRDFDDSAHEVTEVPPQTILCPSVDIREFLGELPALLTRLANELAVLAEGISVEVGYLANAEVVLLHHLTTHARIVPERERRKRNDGEAPLALLHERNRFIADPREPGSAIVERLSRWCDEHHAEHSHDEADPETTNGRSAHCCPPPPRRSVRGLQRTRPIGRRQSP